MFSYYVSNKYKFFEFLNMKDSNYLKIATILLFYKYTAIT